MVIKQKTHSKAFLASKWSLSLLLCLSLVFSSGVPSAVNYYPSQVTLSEWVLQDQPAHTPHTFWLSIFVIPRPQLQSFLEFTRFKDTLLAQNAVIASILKSNRNQSFYKKLMLNLFLDSTAYHSLSTPPLLFSIST